MREQIQLNDELYEYLASVSLREPPVLAELREETAGMDKSFWQISATQGQFMAFLVKLIQARRILEVGVYTGYSSTVMAMALPEGGHLTALDIDEHFTSVAQRYWKKAGVDGRIDLILRPAVDTMDEMIADGRENEFDLCFIDADKPNYLNYYERALTLVRPGGLIIVDNTLFAGRVVGQGLEGLADWQLEWNEAIKAFNRSIKDDDRIELSMVPVGDGMTLCIPR